MNEKIHSKAVEAGGRLTVKSALNPILWLSGIITVPTLLTLGLKPALPIWIAIVGLSPAILAMLGFVFLLFFDRDRLQSEDYQIKKRTLELTQQKGEDPILINPDDAIENPDLQALPKSNSGEEK